MRHEAHFARLLVAREAFANEAAEFVGDLVIAAIAIAQNNKRTWHFTSY